MANWVDVTPEEVDPEFLRKTSVSASYYRANPHRFVKDYFGFNLRPFQVVNLLEMDRNNFFVYIAARGQGKSWLIAVFCCERSVLYPGTKIVITAGTRGQSNNVLEKIKIELMTNSPALRREIKSIVISAQKSEVEFHNGSFIKVVTASDSARSARANILIVDEYRMVRKDIVDAVLKKFLTSSREPGFMRKHKYKKYPKERNKEVYLSSAFFKNHWSYAKLKAVVKNMTDDSRRYFACGLPYELSIAEDLLSPEQVADEMSESGFSETLWQMEMETLWFGDSEGTFFDYNDVSKNRRVRYAMLPDNLSKRISGNNYTIPQKEIGEKRLISVDVALATSTKHRNDATAIFINQLKLTKNNRYTSNIVYAETHEGMHTEDLALLIRILFEEYMCDYIVLDTKGVGFGVFDALIRSLTDPETGEVYPALSCYNDKDMADRCHEPNAPKVIWSIQGNARFNSECALWLRDGFRSGKVRLLVSEFDAQELLAPVKGYSTLTPAEQMQFQLPYVHTTLLINELINLKHEESNGIVKITEKSTARKDRYSSLSYSYWVACQLENQLAKTRNDAFGDSNTFAFRPPIVKKESSPLLKNKGRKYR